MGELVVVNPGVTIGHHTYANRGALIFSGEIGSFCSIAHYTQIGAEQHPIRHLSSSPWMYGPRSVAGASTGFDELAAPPILGSDVWIGSSAIVQQGVTVGHGAIVASGAVVTRDVEPFAIVAGVPARKIGQRFPDDKIAMVLGEPWWEKPVAQLSAYRAAVLAGEQWPAHYREL